MEKTRIFLYGILSLS